MSLQQIVNSASSKRIHFIGLASGSFSLIMCTFHTLRHIQKVHTFHLQWSSFYWLRYPLMLSSGLASSTFDVGYLVFGCGASINDDCHLYQFNFHYTNLQFSAFFGSLLFSPQFPKYNVYIFQLSFIRLKWPTAIVIYYCVYIYTLRHAIRTRGRNNAFFRIDGIFSAQVSPIQKWTATKRL